MADRKDYKMGYSKNKSILRDVGIPTSKFRGYLADDSCESITKNGKNCYRSVIYTADGKTKDCTDFCVGKCPTWLPIMFDNLPTHAMFSDGKEIKIDAIVMYVGAKIIEDDVPDGQYDDENSLMIKFSKGKIKTHYSPFDDEKWKTLSKNEAVDFVCRYMSLIHSGRLELVAILEKGKVKSTWDSFVKKYAKDHNITYGAAMAEAQSAYKKMSDEKDEKDEKRDNPTFVGFRNDKKLFKSGKTWIYKKGKKIHKNTKAKYNDNLKLTIDFTNKDVVTNYEDESLNWWKWKIMTGEDEKDNDGPDDQGYFN